MRLRPDRPFPSNFQIKQKLISIKVLTEASKRRPLPIVIGCGSEIAVEDKFAVFSRDVQFVLIGIKNLNPILRALGEWRAMPSVLVRAVGARLRLARPAWHLELCPSRPQIGLDKSEFDFVHRVHPNRMSWWGYTGTSSQDQSLRRTKEFRRLDPDNGFLSRMRANSIRLRRTALLRMPSTWLPIATNKFTRHRRSLI